MLVRITLPLSLPGVVAIIIYAFVTTWNEFVFALVLALPASVRSFTKTKFVRDALATKISCATTFMGSLLR